MPDTRLTWANLREHLRKWAVVYLVVIGATLLVTNFLWLATSPRVRDENQVLIYLAGPYSNPSGLDDVAADVLERVKAQDPTVEDVTFEGLLFPDPQTDYTGVMLLMTRLATGEGDAFLADPNAMNALTDSLACLPLDDYVADGWLSGYGLEPYYRTYEDEETGQSVTHLIGLRIDALTSLYDREIMDNRGAFLAVASNGRNVDSTLRALEIVVEDLAKGVPQHDPED